MYYFFFFSVQVQGIGDKCKKYESLPKYSPPIFMQVRCICLLIFLYFLLMHYFAVTQHFHFSSFSVCNFDVLPKCPKYIKTQSCMNYNFFFYLFFFPSSFLKQKFDLPIRTSFVFLFYVHFLDLNIYSFVYFCIENKKLVDLLCFL